MEDSEEKTEDDGYIERWAELTKDDKPTVTTAEGQTLTLGNIEKLCKITTIW